MTHTSGIQDTSYTTSHGYQERACFHPEAWVVLRSRCTWLGDHGKDLKSCDPPECPVGWQDIGITGHTIAGAGTTGAASGIQDSSYTMSYGYQERTCVR